MPLRLLECHQEDLFPRGIDLPLPESVLRLPESGRNKRHRRVRRVSVIPVVIQRPVCPEPPVTNEVLVSAIDYRAAVEWEGASVVFVAYCEL